MNKPRITLAALNALNAGDIENFIAAATPGGIEAQEAQGQRQLVQSSTLPKDCPRADLEAMGIVFGADADDLFVTVTLPAGWSKAATGHSMWSDLLDAKGRARAAIFYKAAFYDQRAFAQTICCVNVTRRWYDETEETDAAVISADDGVLFETGRVPRMDYKATDAIEREAHAWADANYPNRRDPLAYWA
jgi:hypothetical protein